MREEHRDRRQSATAVQRLRGMTVPDEHFLDELRLFLESVCCDLCRFEHAERDGVAPEAVHIRQELTLAPGAYADIHVTPPASPPYFVEVDYGYSAHRLLESVRRKYGPGSPDPTGATRLVLVIDTETRSDWSALESEIRAALRPGLTLEVWDEVRLRELVRRRFGVDVPSFEREPDLLELRAGVDRAKTRHAFGDVRSALHPTLLWYLGFWRLRQLRDAGRKAAEDMLAPGLYPNVAVVLADFSGFTGFVRDTRDDAVVRRSLTAFAAKAQYQILNSGGMLYQFLGDSVVAFFGLPERAPEDVARALGCARALLDIGASVATEWQRQIDRVQPAAGMHVGVTIGDIQIVSFQPFGQTHFGAVGDAINLAARLNGLAGTDEIVASNSFYQRLPEATRAEFAEMEPVEAKNFGRVRAWKRGAR
jgi:class 3 adenylate cyclase